MIIRALTQKWQPCLHQVSLPVEITKNGIIWEVVIDLIDTMRANNLVWIAAPQIWMNMRIFVTEIRKTPTRNPTDFDILRTYINPEILWFSDEKSEVWEWCWSVQSTWVFGKVIRPESIEIRAQDIDGSFFTMKASWLLARVIQHEFDHINGILFTDHIDQKSLISKEEYITIAMKI